MFRVIVIADSRPPTAIRITRPFGSEDEYLQHEVDTLTRTTIMLPGALPRPEGTVIRFELALASGQVLLRGEGRVLGMKAGAEGASALVLRFTRLDIRSKALVDRAAAIREQRGGVPSAPPPPPAHSAPRASSAVPTVTAAAYTAVTIASASPRNTLRFPAPVLDGGPSPANVEGGAAVPPPAPVPVDRAADSESAMAASATGATAPPVTLQSFPPPPAESSSRLPRVAPDRDELLMKLRERARSLEPSVIKALLASSPRRALP